MDEGRPPDPAPAFPAPEPDPSDADAGDGRLPLTDDVHLQPAPPGRALVAIAVVLVVALVAFAFVGGRIVTAGPESTPHPDPRLAVTDRNGRLHTATPDGRSIGDLDLPGTQFGFPTWSPDATRIAVTGQDDDSI